MKKIAVTGNIGCGKSYVMNHIKNCDVFVLDMDQVAKEVRNDMSDVLLQHFHCQDEKQLSTIIFNDVKKREELEQLLYPPMLVKMEAFFKEHQDELQVFVEVPLLFEKKWDVYFDEVWSVYASEETALKRLIQHRNFTKEEALARLRQQMSIDEKVKRSDVVIYNDDQNDVLSQIEKHMKRKG